MNSLSEAVCMRSVLQAAGLLRCEAALRGEATWLPQFIPSEAKPQSKIKTCKRGSI
jgi:hypothetical protein